MAKRTDPKNYQIVVQHDGQDRPSRESFHSPDTAYGRVKRAYEYGASTAQLIRKTDGVILWDGPADIAIDWQQW